jgi:hypothetical protein
MSRRDADTPYARIPRSLSREDYLREETHPVELAHDADPGRLPPARLLRGGAGAGLRGAVG